MRQYGLGIKILEPLTPATSRRVVYYAVKRYNNYMISRDQALSILRAHRAELNALGVCRAAVFGSVSRGEPLPDSDLDIMIEMEESARLTVFDYVGIRDKVAALFPVPTDVVDASAMKSSIARSAARDAVYAF